MKKGWCKVCGNRLKERYKNKTVEEVRKVKGGDGGGVKNLQGLPTM
jgi:hypothetical protein